jgi:hypothetical protein
MNSGFAPDRRSPNLVYEQNADSTSDLQPKQFRPAELSSLRVSSEKARTLQKKVTYLSRTMHHNLQAAMLRGDDLVDLERKAGELELGSKAFSKASTDAHRIIWWNEQRYRRIALGALVIVTCLFTLWVIIRHYLPFPF